MENESVNWLLKSDPSIVFQTKRDILCLPKKDWIDDQKKISESGWGKRILESQDPDGNWSGGKPSSSDTNNLYTLLLLKRMEMLPNEQTYKGITQLIKRKSIARGPQRRELCIAGMGLGILSYFKYYPEIIPDILGQIEERKLKDGAWNCVVRDSHHSSINTSLSILEGLAQVKSNYPKYTNEIDDLVTSAHEFLLVHKLFKSHKTGKIIADKYTDISFPADWRYNILKVLDYFRSISFEYDERMDEAIEIIKKRGNNGYWPQGKPMRHKRFVEFGKNPSEFNTLRALRVLKYFNQA